MTTEQENHLDIPLTIEITVPFANFSKKPRIGDRLFFKKYDSSYAITECSNIIANSVRSYALKLILFED